MNSKSETGNYGQCRNVSIRASISLQGVADQLLQRRRGIGAQRIQLRIQFFGHRRHGDRLLPQVKKAELIEGVVSMGDLRNKRRACCRNGVREYLDWLVAEARREWSCLENDDYRPQLPDAQGVRHSRVFTGLRLPVAPLMAGDTAKVVATLTGPEPLNTKLPETSVKSEGRYAMQLVQRRAV